MHHRSYDQGVSESGGVLHPGGGGLYSGEWGIYIQLGLHPGGSASWERYMRYMG